VVLLSPRHPTVASFATCHASHAVRFWHFFVRFVLLVWS
jgi:hypothetical protein